MNTTDCLGQTLTVSPLKPKRGEVFTFTYDPKGGKFENDTLKTATILISDGFNQESRKADLIKDGKVYHGKFQLDSATLMVALAFSSKKVWDSAPKDGHLYAVYEGDKPVEGALSVLADFYISKNGKAFYGFEPNYEKAASLLKQEIELHPTGKYKVPALYKYYQAIYKLDPEKGRVEILANIKAIEQQSTVTDIELYKKFRFYEILEMKAEMEKTLELITTTFPNSPVIFSRRYKNAVTPQAAIQMEVLANKLILDYNMVNGKEFSSLANSVYRSVNQAYIKELNLPKFYFYLGKLNDQAFKLTDLITATTFLAESKKELVAAEKMAKWGLLLIDTLANTPELRRLKERKVELTGLLGRIYYEKGEFDKAFVSLKNAYQENTEKLAFINTYFGLVLVKHKDYETAKPLLQETIRAGSADDEIILAFKEAYLGANGKLTDYTIDLASLKKEAQALKKAALQKIMQNSPAPNFSLLDNKGKRVSLADYKGKIVVLDFWATWCIPCLEAFPGMNKLTKKYENDKDVVFLFINTGETFTKDLTKNINTYLDQYKYNFHVLIDEKDIIDGTKKYKAQNLYDANTIPLKVVIDKSGNVRFRSVGYLGSDERVVEELSGFIEAARL